MSFICHRPKEHTQTTGWGHCLTQSNLTRACKRIVDLRFNFKHPVLKILAFLSNQTKPKRWDSLPVLTTHCPPGCAGAGVRFVAHRPAWWNTEPMCSRQCTSSGWWCSRYEHRGNLERWWPQSQSLEHPLATLEAWKFKHGWALIRSRVYFKSKYVWLPKPS